MVGGSTEVGNTLAVQAKPSGGNQLVLYFQTADIGLQMGEFDYVRFESQFENGATQRRFLWSRNRHEVHSQPASKSFSEQTGGSLGQEIESKIFGVNKINADDILIKN